MNEFKQAQADKVQKRIESGGKCKFCVQVLTLPKPKIKSFYEAMMFEKDTVTNETIHEVLTKWGLDVSKTALDNHRRGYAKLSGGVRADGYTKHMTNLKRAAGLNG